MPATALLRRTATVLTATAIAVPSFAALGSSAWAAQPADHGRAASHPAKPAHSARAHGHKSHQAATHKSPSKAAAHHPAHAASAAGHTAPSHSAPSHSSDAAAQDPRGNNGTVFIHDVAGDTRPHNVPHVGCTFYVDFFGFDSDQVLSTSFVGQAPTGAGTPLPTGDWTGAMPANGASGAGRDFDAEQAFTLDTSVLGAPQAQQGYHVKLTVSTGEPGGVKHKVFWIAPCEEPAAVAPATEQLATPTVVRGPRSEPPAAPQVLGLSVTRTLPMGITRVLAESAVRPSSGLPFTGAAGIGLLLAVAGVVVAAGCALLIAGHRRSVYTLWR